MEILLPINGNPFHFPKSRMNASAFRDLWARVMF